jgi:HEAT repeat protein
MQKMIADHMEGGFLENIIDMFKHDRGLYSTVARLMADERGRVRLGTVALIEALREIHREEIVRIIPEIAALLRNPNPTIRADAAYLLGVIGHRDAIPYLKEAEGDDNGQVRAIIRESLEDIQEAEVNST